MAGAFSTPFPGEMKSVARRHARFAIAPAAVSAMQSCPRSHGPMTAARKPQLGSRRAAFVTLAASLICFTAPYAAAEFAAGPKSGLPLPRFVSLKPDRVNVRGGPTRDHEVTFVYTRAGLPVEITAESDNWRRIRDWEG